MTDNKHPITPPPELVETWIREANHNEPMFAQVAVMGARWGADQQLELDAKWLDHNALNEAHLKIAPMGEVLKEAMRPKPSSLKEQALEALCHLDKGAQSQMDTTEAAYIIRCALEQLPDTH